MRAGLFSHANELVSKVGISLSSSLGSLAYPLTPPFACRLKTSCGEDLQEGLDGFERVTLDG